MSLLEFIKNVHKLKKIPRSGWINCGIQFTQVDSVAAHTFMTSFLTMLFTDILRLKGWRLDVERAMRMSILHDLTETLTFDISKQFFEYIEGGERLKRQITVEAQKTILSNLSLNRLRSEYQEIIKGLEESCIETKIVKAADKFEILTQIIDYESMGYPRRIFKNLWQSAEKEINLLGIDFFILLLKEFRKTCRKI